MASSPSPFTFPISTAQKSQTLPLLGPGPSQSSNHQELVAVSSLSPLGPKYFQGLGPNHERPGSRQEKDRQRRCKQQYYHGNDVSQAAS